MLSTKKIAGLCGIVLASGAIAGAAILVPGASAAGRAPTTVTVTAPSTATVGVAFAVNITVAPTAGTGTPSGLYAVQGPTSILCRGVLQNGAATCDITQNTAGTLNLTIRYGGDLNYLPSFTTTTVAVGQTSGGGGGSSAPSWTADTPPLTATANTPYGYQFVATGTPAPTYALTTTSTWLSINAATGQVSGIVPPGATGTFSYSVTASNSSGTITAGPITVSIVPASSDATLVTTLSCPRSIVAGDAGACTVSLTNSGPGTAAGTGLNVELPSGLTLTGCDGCSLNGSTLSWSFGSMAAGATENISIEFTAVSPAPMRHFVTIRAQATTTTFDPLPFSGDAAAAMNIVN